MSKYTDGAGLATEAPIMEPARQFFFIDRCRELVGKLAAEYGRKLTVHVETFGCQMNFKDSEKLLGVLEAVGFESVENEKADLVIYNTCTVRENANTRVYGRIGYLGNLKKKNPKMMIAMCGCMMQEEHVVEKIKESYSFVDLIFGTHNIYKLAELLFYRLSTGKYVCEILKSADKIVESLPSERKYSFKAGVNIMFGCDNFCTYCIVPYVRGRERSRKSEDILEEIRDMAANGVKEIMLLGQNVNSYGKNLDEPISFAQLLAEAEKIDGIERIRFMTSHPKDLSDELIEVMARSKKICRHLHLPVQSGSSRILHKMNRHYTREDYFALVGKIRKAMPDIALTTDIIVGFPTETEEDFEDTLSLCKEVEYDNAFTFIYSKRTGTPAAQMESVDEDVVKDRFDRLLKVIGEASAKKAAMNVGKTVSVLVEEKNDHDPALMTGRLDNNLLVHFPGDESLLGKFVKVKLDECKGFYYIGELVTVAH